MTSTAWGTLLRWALFLAVLTAVQLVFDPAPTTLILLGGAALVIAALGGYLLSTRRREAPYAEPPRPLPDVSFWPILLGLALAGAALGAEVGLWLVLLSIGAGLFAVAGLTREHRAQRDAARRAGEARGAA